MVLPIKAKLEKVLENNCAIYNINKLIAYPLQPRYNKRPPNTEIVRLFFHHSGAYGKDGFAGVQRSNDYVIVNRNFGAHAYHYWLAYKPDIDQSGNCVIYKLAPDSVRCWHTGQRCNDEGIGICWQGNLSKFKTGAPSDEQYVMAEALTNYLIAKYNLKFSDTLSFHAEAKKYGAKKNKASCPGPYVKKWVKGKRAKFDNTCEVKNESLLTRYYNFFKKD